jgi:hypothetical protein
MYEAMAAQSDYQAWVYRAEPYTWESDRVISSWLFHTSNLFGRRGVRGSFSIKMIVLKLIQSLKSDL